MASIYDGINAIKEKNIVPFIPSPKEAVNKDIKNRIHLSFLRKIRDKSPSEWLGGTQDGQFLFGCFKNGYLFIGKGKTIKDAMLGDVADGERGRTVMCAEMKDGGGDEKEAEVSLSTAEFLLVTNEVIGQIDEIQESTDYTFY